MRKKILGVIDNSWALPPLSSEVKAWDKFSAAEQDRFDHIMSIYAAVVEHMDRSIGRLVDALKQRGELDNTIIMFMSDNGASAEGDDGRLEGLLPGGAQSKVMQGQCWATLSNTPFRKWKGRTHEGGISTPLIIHWPQGIKQRVNYALNQRILLILCQPVWNWPERLIRKNSLAR